MKIAAIDMAMSIRASLYTGIVRVRFFQLSSAIFRTCVLRPQPVEISAAHAQSGVAGQPVRLLKRLARSHVLEQIKPHPWGDAEFLGTNTILGLSRLHAGRQ